MSLDLDNNTASDDMSEAAGARLTVDAKAMGPQINDGPEWGNHNPSEPDTASGEGAAQQQDYTTSLTHGATQPSDGWKVLSGLESYPPIECLVPNLLYPGHVTFMFAQGGVGKSAFTIHLAMSLATGKPFAGMAPSKRCKTLIVAAEDDYETQANRAFAARAALGVTADDPCLPITTHTRQEPILLIKPNHGKDVAGPTVPTSLANEIAHICDRDPTIRLVIVDPFVEAHSFDESSNVEMAAVGAHLRNLARTRDVALLLVHHVSKTGTGQNAARGASALVNLGRVGIYLEAMSESEAEKAGVSDAERRRIVKMSVPKINLGPNPPDRWLEKRSVELPAGGTSVGLYSREFAYEIEDCSKEHWEAIRAAVEIQQFSAAPNAPKGRLDTWIAETLGMTDARAKAVVDSLRKQQLLHVVKGAKSNGQKGERQVWSVVPF